MDPVSHAIFGRTLIALDRRGRFGTGTAAAAALGALAPDIDAVVMSRGWDVYLRTHEIGTHSILGSIVMGCAAASLVHLLRRGSRYTQLILAATIGSLSHVLFDLVSGANIRLAWPFRQTRSTLPLVAMADPWLIAICALGAIALWMLRRRTFAVATTVVATIAAFLALKAVMMTVALPQWRASAGTDPIVHHAVQASWSSLTEWHVSDRTPHSLRKWHVDAIRGAALSFSIPLRTEAPLVTASRSLEVVRNFLRVHDTGFAVAAPHEHGTEVLWSDIRYCRAISDCALWFGAVFDRSGRPVTQVVRVGQWHRSRPVSP